MSRRKHSPLWYVNTFSAWGMLLVFLLLVLLGWMEGETK